MIAISLIINVALLLWVFVLYWQVKKITKDLTDIGRWSAYLETSMKDAQILIFNSEKGKHGEYEVNKKLSNLLK